MREALRELSERRDHAAVLALCAVAVVLFQYVRWDWFIDDAAICFAYARNLADGEGLVPRPGGERIEGFSDPTWVALLALFQLVGLDGFTVAKPLGALFSVLTLPLVWRTARLAMPGHEGPAPLFAPMFLAANMQFALWGTSGLENALFVLLLSWAILRTVADAGSGSPRNALLWLALAWTRPEGILYAAIGGAWFLAWTVRAGKVRPFVIWLLLLVVPSVALELARIWYFAWPVPNTWYAKIETRETQRFSWSSRGWMQARDWAARSWNGWLAPLYVAGLTGTRGRGAALAFGMAGLVALSLAWPGPDALRGLPFWPDLPDPPSPFTWGRVGLVLAVGAVLPWWAADPPGGRARALCWHAVFVALVFSIYADGDWMGGFRWMSLMGGPLAVLFACGVREVADRVEELFSGGTAWSAAGWLTAASLVSAQIPPNFAQMRQHVSTNTNETPARVKKRVDYTSRVARRLFIDAPIVNLEMDMGAHLWWRPRSIDVDMAGLVDIPMSRHTYKDRAFIQHYVFDEQRPMFAHVHGWWAKFSGFPTYGAWQDAYFELPPYVEIAGLPLPERHPGVWARRVLLMSRDTSVDPLRSAVFEGGPSVLGFDVPTPWGAGARGFFEVRLRAPGADGGPRFRLLAFLSNGTGTVASFDLPMGNGFLPVDKWRADEVFVGRYAVPVPTEIPPGTYDLGFVAIGGDGQVLPVSPPAPGTAPQPAFARGEARWSGVVEVVTREVATDRATARWSAAIALAGHGGCAPAEDSWELARRTLPWDDAFVAAHAPAAESALATCWADLAARDAANAAEFLARAHRWDHRDPRLADVGREVGERLWAEGLAARAASDWKTAYARFSALLRFQPWRAWARRHAEEARDHVLAESP